MIKGGSKHRRCFGPATKQAKGDGWSDEELQDYMGEFNHLPGILNVDVVRHEISWPWYVYDTIHEVQVVRLLNRDE